VTAGTGTGCAKGPPGSPALAAGASSRAPSPMLTFGIHSSHFGMYQLRLPSRVSVAGTRTERTMVASTRTAMARPKPICWSMTMSPRANPPNTATIISAAPVISRPVELRPKDTASVLSPVCLNRSRIRLSRNTW